MGIVDEHLERLALLNRCHSSGDHRRVFKRFDNSFDIYSGRDRNTGRAKSVGDIELPKQWTLDCFRKLRGGKVEPGTMNIEGYVACRDFGIGLPYAEARHGDFFAEGK